MTGYTQSMRSFGLKVVVAVTLAAVVLVAALLGAELYKALQPPSVSIQVERVFVDLNGDGALDLLVRGEVIYNQVPLALTAQP